MGFPFSDHVELLKQFLAARRQIAVELERRLFGSQGKTHARSGDRESVGDTFDECFFESSACPRHLRGLKGQLAAAHLADGFEPAAGDGYSRALDPVELVLRACHHWDHDRWPGTSGRMAYTHRLFAVYILRLLESLTLRIWDEGNEAATERLTDVQRLLDRLNASSPDAPLVRDARWLIQTAQGPLTRHVRPYFMTAAKIAESFTAADRLEIHKAGAVLAGGHLRSQLRRLSWQTGWRFDDPQLLALTRSSNSMDLALLVRDLVPLLQAYDAVSGSDPMTFFDRGSDPNTTNRRLELADAILQGLSADPELLISRVDLLGPSMTLEDLFVDQTGDHARWTPLGHAQRVFLRQYTELIARTSESLRHDALAFNVAHTAYSPLGNVYGFCADLFSNMALTTLRSPVSGRMSLEDVFASRERADEKRVNAHEWEALPRAEGERKPFECSSEWAAQMFARLISGLDAHATEPRARLYVVPRNDTSASLQKTAPPASVVSATEHCFTSDVERARVRGAGVIEIPAKQFITHRAEGRFLGSALVAEAWFGVSKAPLTLFLSRGKDAIISDIPSPVVDVLLLVCGELLVLTP